MAATARVLFHSPLIKISDYTCNTPKSGCGCERCDPTSAITIIRRGVHAFHARARVALAAPGVALLYRGGEPYRLSHPYERAAPDRSTCIEFDAALLEEAFGTRPLVRDLGTPLSSGTQLRNFQIVSALGSGQCDQLAAEETVLALVEAIAGDFDLSREEPAVAATARRRVERARAFIADRPEANPGLYAVAAAAACSPFHLTRLFKQQTGMTIRAYRLRLRLAVALQEIADGAMDLAALALRAGFSHHSHMTVSFQKVFGMPPSMLRERMRGRGLSEQSKFLKAALTPQT